MKKKGFTLIELLAVIVILAVIAIIATPAVLNIIEDSKKAAAEASARNIVSAAKSYYMQNLMDNISIGTIDLSKKTLAYNTLSFETSSEIELIIESEGIKNLTKEDLIVIQVDSETGKVYFVSLSDYDEKNGYATVTLPILGPTMFAMKV